MMEDICLSQELEQLERRLAALERPQPPCEAKERLLRTVRAELRRAQVRSRWAFAVAIAATALIWLNVSLCATQSTDCGLGLDGARPSLEDRGEQIRQALPELAPRETMRQSILLRAGTEVIPCPRLSAGDVAQRKSDVWKELMN